MESTEVAVRFVAYTFIEVATEAAFCPKGMNEFFFCKDHPFKEGDRVKLTIEKVPDANPNQHHHDR